MRIEKFEDIIAWQKARILTNVICDLFGNCRDFELKDQIKRASLSVMNNIAEGFDRKGDKEFKRFLCIAKGSCGETRSMLYIALDRKHISEKDFNDVYKITVEISKLIVGFMKSLG